MAASLGSFASNWPSLIYTSTNSGLTWKVVNSLYSYEIVYIASSADGAKLVAAPYGGDRLYTSADSGATWAQTPALPPPYSQVSAVACSADGTRLVLAGGDSGIFVSQDSGGTWVSARAPFDDWSSVATSADGTKLYAATSGHGEATGAIYTLQLPMPIPPPMPPPRLAIARSGGNLVLSWLVPSTRFVLQQNAEPTGTNWTDVPMTPALNFSNLNYEMIMARSPESGFYRLKQH
jgi:hypothetical protein